MQRKPSRSGVGYANVLESTLFESSIGLPGPGLEASPMRIVPSLVIIHKTAPFVALHHLRRPPCTSCARDGPSLTTLVHPSDP